MAIPDGYKQVQEIAVEEHVPPNRVQTALERLEIVQYVFPDDRRLRYCAPQDVARIKEWLAQYQRDHEPTTARSSG